MTLHEELRRALARRAVTGTAGTQSTRRLAAGDGWRVEDVLCTCGHGDPSGEDQHAGIAIGLVVAGSFEYHASGGRALLLPGSLLLGLRARRVRRHHRHRPGVAAGGGARQPRGARDGGAAGIRAHARRPRRPLPPEPFSFPAHLPAGDGPHQYVLRLRLRKAAARLLRGDARILDVALDCGFCDLSNFNRAFRAELGMTPRAYRRRHAPVTPRGPASSPRRRDP